MIYTCEQNSWFWLSLYTSYFYICYQLPIIYYLLQIAPKQSKPFEPPPATITLRPQPPVSQAPPPVFTSQPATATLRGMLCSVDDRSNHTGKSWTYTMWQKIASPCKHLFACTYGYWESSVIGNLAKTKRSLYLSLVGSRKKLPLFCSSFLRCFQSICFWYVIRLNRF